MEHFIMLVKLIRLRDVKHQEDLLELLLDMYQLQQETQFRIFVMFQEHHQPLAI